MVHILKKRTLEHLFQNHEEQHQMLRQYSKIKLSKYFFGPKNPRFTCTLIFSSTD